MSHDDNDSALTALKSLSAPQASETARAHALAASRRAFEDMSAQHDAQIRTEAKGSGWMRRLNSMMPSLKGHWAMDMRIPLGTAAAALLLFPLGLQLFNSTALTPPPLPLTASPQPEVAAERPSAQAERTQEEMAPTPARPAADADAEMMAAPPSPMPQSTGQSSVNRTAQSLDGSHQQYMESFSMAPPSQEPMGGIAGRAESGDSFTSFDESRLKAVSEEPVSTFSIDVDTASYSYIRRLLEDGYLPQPDAVRIEELINYFPYEYAGPESAEVPFEPTIGIMPTPWNDQTQLLQIGIKGFVPPANVDAASNLVFLIDTSGSMEDPDKLPLLKRAFGLLVEQLSDNDTVSIVVYAGSAGVVLEPTVATEKAKILSALDRLSAGGSTAGAAGIELAYGLAEQSLVTDGVNRVILATDGDFNVGLEDPSALEDYIRTKRDSGVFLSVLGFGAGNLGDDTMQSLAQNGNGNASYISSFREAQKVLVEEIGGTLQTIAKDVKIQVEFNPAVVSEYRLIGYETRALNREDFNNDTVDAGDIGAGHTVTAIYEITPTGSAGALIDPLRYGGSDPAATGGTDEIAFLRMRYKLPDSDVSQLLEEPITPEMVYGDVADAPIDLRFAAAVTGFGQKLKGSDYAGALEWPAIRSLAQAARGADESGYRAEFVQLIDLAASLSD